MSDLQLPKSFGFVRLLRPFLAARGVDERQYRLIVAAKFTLATRSKDGLDRNAKPRLASRHPVLIPFLLNLIIGAGLALLMLIPLPLLLSQTALMSALFLVFFLTMLTSYASIILDPRDRPIYTTRGVANQTLNAARLTVVGFFLGITMVALAAPACVVLTLRFNLLVGLATFISALLLAGFSLALALFMYLLVLQFFDGEKLKNVLNGIQILLAVGLYAAAQLPNILGPSFTIDFDWGNTAAWWMVLVPPVWFAGLPLLAGGVFGVWPLLMAALSVAVPVLMLAGYARNAGRFESLLAKLDESSTKQHRDGWYFKLTRRWFTASPEEATDFTLAWRLFESEREFKLRVYPQLAYAVIVPAALGANFVRDFSLQTGLNLAVYLGTGVILAVPTMLLNVRFSSQPDAMAVYQYVPNAHPGRLARATVMALFAKLVLPFLLIIAALLLPFAGLRALWAGATATALTLCTTLIMGRMTVDRTPFAAAYTAQKGMVNQGVGCVTMIIGMIVVMLVIFLGGLFHSFIFDLILILALGLSTWGVAHSYRNITHFK